MYLNLKQVKSVEIAVFIMESVPSLLVIQH